MSLQEKAKALAGKGAHILKSAAESRWEEVDVMPYKEDGTHFKSISRQTLFHGSEGMPIEFRCFEIQEGGHSTLERHDHVHLVMVIRGSGEVFVKDQIHPIGVQDVVHVPAQTWHQFRANQGEPLAFLCLVHTERDRPERPNETTKGELLSIPGAEDFLRF